MTGPDHIRTAQDLLLEADRLRTTDAHNDEQYAVMQALTHAVLALAIATTARVNLDKLINDAVDQAVREHVEDTPHIYPDGSRS